MTEQHTPLTPEDWIDKGYKKLTSSFKPYAAFGLQKRFDDDIGKCYFITVWVYDNTQYLDRHENRSKWGFQPEIQFTTKDDKTFDVTFHHRNDLKWGVTSIEEVEAFFYNMWEDMDCDYYETWEY